MNILSCVTRSAKRIKSGAALLIIAVLAASSWLVLRADVPQVASGTWVAAGEVGAIPAGAASVALADGRVLVAGGTIGGVLSDGVAFYDPASGTWVAGGNLALARSGHAAAVLKDGRVLFAGGTASYGPSFDVEIYDPAAGTSVHAGDMTLPRVDHAAATLKDGRVLIVGGSDGLTALSVAEIFDPATGQTAAAPAMSTGRARATATTMLDGHVLITGGSDGTNDLASAEIFEPASGSFFGTGTMQTARSGHVAVLLPNNNQVLIAGGLSAGAAVASAELYADWNDGFSTTPNPMSVARAGGLAGGLQTHDLALVAGGGSTSGEFYGYATVKTDRADYWPGEAVTVTGAGWQPGETVTIVISEDADTHFDFTYSAVTDAAGRITNAEFAPIENEVFHHFGKKFYVAARGAASAALNTFTDGNVTLHLLAAESVADMTVAYQRFDSSTTCTGTAAVTSSLIVSAGGTVNIPSFGGSGNSVRLTSVTTTTIGKTFDTWTSGDNKNDSGTLLPGSPSPCIANDTSTNGSVSDAYAHFKNATGTTYGTADPALTGSLVGFLAADAVTASYSRTAGETVAGGPYTISAALRPGGVLTNYAITYNTASLTITPAVASVTANAAGKNYGAIDPVLTGSLSGFLAADNVTATYARTAGETVAGGPYTITATLGPAAVLGNYTITSNPAGFTIAKTVASVAPNAAGKIYGGVDPAFSGTLSGFLAADAVTASYSRTAGETVGAYVISAVLAPAAVLGNYEITATTASFDIAQKTASVTPAAAGKTYGAMDSAFSGTLEEIEEARERYMPRFNLDVPRMEMMEEKQRRLPLKTRKWRAS